LKAVERERIMVLRRLSEQDNDLGEELIELGN